MEGPEMQMNYDYQWHPAEESMAVMMTGQCKSCPCYFLNCKAQLLTGQSPKAMHAFPIASLCEKVIESIVYRASMSDPAGTSETPEVSPAEAQAAAQCNFGTFRQETGRAGRAGRAWGFGRV